LSSIKSAVSTCACERHNAITLDAIVVEADALQQVAAYLKKHAHERVAVVADANTYQAAGETLIHNLNGAGIEPTLVLVKPDARGDVVADEATLVQIMLDIPHQTSSVILAVGSGTIHDLVRFAAYKMGKPFLSIPTAPSVDGFTSVGAPLILRGVKTTIPAIAPAAIFADLNVLMEAPQRLVAAGFGDMLGKYTSLFDWSFAHHTAGEPFCQAAAQLTRDALENCVQHVNEIGSRREEGIRILMNALIQSGLAMLLFGQSHPASGSEHHLSHYWEMEYLKLGRKQLLHGAKVGVACAEISHLYPIIAADGYFQTQWDEFEEHVSRIPSPDRIRGLLKQAGGPATPEDLGIDQELLARSLAEAHHVRNRYTLLKAYNELRSSEAVLTSVTPILRIFDEDKAKQFYMGFLDFQLDWEHRFEEGTPVYMQISDGKQVILHLSEHHGDGTPGSAVRIEVQHIETLHAKLLNKDYKYARPGLETTSWNTKEISIKDPFGNRIIYYQRV
jgi:glycerol-1-phosphate dehydrogenase [NAD(P)+]